jgi:hypothetical protein
MANNVEILTIWHLRRVVPMAKFCFLPVKSFINETGRSHGHALKKAPPYSCTQTIVSLDAIFYPIYSFR